MPFKYGKGGASTNRGLMNQNQRKQLDRLDREAGSGGGDPTLDDSRGAAQKRKKAERVAEEKRRKRIREEMDRDAVDDSWGAAERRKKRKRQSSGGKPGTGSR